MASADTAAAAAAAAANESAGLETWPTVTDKVAWRSSKAAGMHNTQTMLWLPLDMQLNTCWQYKHARQTPAKAMTAPAL
jgi:hypothetical protein